LSTLTIVEEPNGVSVVATLRDGADVYLAKFPTVDEARAWIHDQIDDGEPARQT
jgi:hypothetical protein